MGLPTYVFKKPQHAWMKPHIRKLGKYWTCFQLGGFREGEGVTPAKAYATFERINKRP